MIKKKITDLLFPPRCALCDSVIPGGKMICRGCAAKLRPVGRETCRKCGKSLQNTNSIYCYDCSKKVHYYDRGFAIFEYRDVKAGLYRFKYAGRAEYARFYAACAYKFLGGVIGKLHPDAFVPVPIHKKRLNKRGYNQAEVLATELSKLFGVPVVNDLIVRAKATVPLKNLNEEGRINNLKKAFIMGSNGVKLETIVIIDDIYTTGSTIDAISRLCRQAGVKEIYFLTIAIGKGL